MATMAEKRHELLKGISSMVSTMVSEHGLPSDVAEQIGTNVSNFICDNFGGQNFTFPKDRVYKLAQRDKEICRLFNGHNYFELARKYNVSEKVVREAVRRSTLRPLTEEHQS